MANSATETGSFSTNYARFTTQDPLAEKTPHLSPYAYCAGNPMRFVDNDGRKVRIYVEMSGLGHAFITTREGDNTIVYTYGRYGALKESSGSTFGELTPAGEGVLGRLTEDAAAKYIQNVSSGGCFSIFELNNLEETDIEEYYDTIFNLSNKSPSNPTKSTFNNVNYKVIDTYNLLNNNCVTTTKAGLESAGMKRIPQSNIPRYWSRQLSRIAENDNDITELENPGQFIKELMDNW